MGLKLQPEFIDEWFIKVYSDSDWAGDKDSRKSVTGFFIFVNGALVGWRSKSQHCISLSSSEAEMYALTEAIKEVPFLVQLLLFIGVKVKLPVQVKVDNMGAIYMSENSTPSARTRHADIRQKFTADLQDKGLIKVDFVKSEDNTSDILTKNVSVDLFKYHTQHLIVEKAEVEGKGDKSPVRKGVGGVTGSLSPRMIGDPGKTPRMAPREGADGTELGSTNQGKSYGSKVHMSEPMSEDPEPADISGPPPTSRPD
jgi:hypothetical protein